MAVNFFLIKTCHCVLRLTHNAINMTRRFIERSDMLKWKFSELISSRVPYVRYTLFVSFITNRFEIHVYTEP